MVVRNVVLIEGITSTGRQVSQLAVGTGLDHLAGIHEDAGVGVIGDDESMEAPFIAQHAGDQVVVAAGPGVADPVEGGHHTGAGRDLGGGVGVAAVVVGLGIVHIHSAALDSQLKGLEVDFAGRLLVEEGSQAVLAFTVAAVVLLVVDGEVLHKDVHATGSNAADFQRSHGAGQEGIFGVVLGVTAGEGGAVGVHGRCVPAIHIQVVGLIADIFAVVQGQLIVVGLGQHDDTGVGDVLGKDEVAAVVEAIVQQTGGRVTIGSSGLVHRLDGSRAVAGLGDQGLVIAGRQLVKQLVPLGIVVGQAAHIDQAEAVVRTIGDGVGQGGRIGGVQRVEGIQLGQVLVADGLVVGIGGRLTVGIGTVDLVAPGADLIADLTVGGGPGAGPVLTGQVLQAAVGIIQQVGDSHTGGSVGGIGSGIHGAVGRGVGGDHRGVALGGHAVLHRLALDGQDVVDGVMGILGGGDVVVARIQDVGLGGGVVVGLELLLIEGDSHRLRGAGRQFRGLGVTDQLDRRLLDFVLLVVVGVGALGVDFYNVLAGAGTGVLHVHRDGAGGAVPGSLVVGPVKGGVGQTVAERIHHGICIAVVAGVALAEDGILVAGLVVTIAHVDAFLVADVVVLGLLAVLGVVREVTEVLGGRAAQGIHLIGIHCAAGGVDVAGKDFRQGVQAVIAHGRCGNHRVDVGELGYPAQIHRSAGVEQQHHVVEVIVEVLQDGQLIGVGFQVGLGLIFRHIGVVVHRAGHIAALTHDTAVHEDGHRALHGIQQAGFALHDGQRAFIDREVLVITVVHRAHAADVVLAGTVGVEVPQRLIDAEAAGLKRSLEVALGAADVSNRGMAHKAEGRIGAVGHLVLIVLQQHDAFACDLLVQRDLILHQGIQRFELGFAVLHVDAVGLGIAVVDAGILQAQHALHAAGVGRNQNVGRYNAAGQHHTQNTGNGRFDDLDSLFSALLFLCHDSFLLL